MEDIMNFIKKVKGVKLSNNKCYLLFPVLVWFTGINAFAQHGGISIKLEFASVTRSLNRHNPYKGVADKDTVPYLISFAFFVQNHTDKKLLFGTNTKGYYWKYEKYYYKDYNYGVIGRFFMINGEDVIPLFTDYYNIVPFPDGEEPMLWGGIEYRSSYKRTSVFRDFLCRFSRPGTNTKEYIYEYLRQARIIYVPVVSDYERWFNMPRNELKKNEVVYPQDTIEVYKNDPFQIFFLWSDDQEFYEIYPRIDYNNREMESDDDN